MYNFIQEFSPSLHNLTLEQKLYNLQKDNTLLRKLLWVNHNCPFHGRYGDDGEMQCHVCGVDFKRDAVSKIIADFERMGLKQLASVEIGK